MRSLFVTVLVAIAYASLYPFHWLEEAKPFHYALSIPQDRSVWLDSLLNLLFYVPLGFLGVFAFKGPIRLVVAGLWIFGTVTSMGLEWAQTWVASRFATSMDVALNSLGTLLGALLALPLRGTEKIRDRFGLRGELEAWFLLSCWVVWHCFPFIPALRILRLQYALDATLHPEIRFLDCVDFFLGGWLVWLLLEHVTEDRRFLRVGAVSVAAAMVMWRMFVIGQTFSPAAVVLTMAGIGAARAVGGRRVPLIAGMLAVWLLVRELYPFQFGGAARAFNWTPFAELMENHRGDTARIIGGKAFLYAGAVWALRQAGLPLAWSGVIVAALLGVGEWLQRYLPGRTPEITDVVMALGGAAVVGWLAMLSKRERDPAGEPR